MWKIFFPELQFTFIFLKKMAGDAHKCMIWFVIWIVTILVSASVVLVYQKFSFLASMPSVVWLGFFVYLRQVCICVFGQINRYVQVCINYNRCHVFTFLWVMGVCWSCCFHVYFSKFYPLRKSANKTFDMLLYLNPSPIIISFI